MRNGQLTGDEIPKEAGNAYDDGDIIWCIDLNRPAMQPFQTSYKGWKLLTTNYVILGRATPANVIPNPSPVVRKFVPDSPSS